MEIIDKAENSRCKRCGDFKRHIKGIPLFNKCNCTYKDKKV